MITHILVEQKDRRILSPLAEDSKTAFLENANGATTIIFSDIDGKPTNSILETPFQQIADAMIAAGLAIDATKDNISEKISNNDAAIAELRKILKTNDEELSAAKNQIANLNRAMANDYDAIQAMRNRINGMERVARQLYRDGSIGKADLEAFGITVDQEGSSS